MGLINSIDENRELFENLKAHSEMAIEADKKFDKPMKLNEILELKTFPFIINVIYFLAQFKVIIAQWLINFGH